MLLKDKTSGKLVDIEEMTTLLDPFHHKIKGTLQWGEEPADPELFEKICLSFPSGEPLPACWTDEHYRDHEIKRSAK